MKKKSNSRYLGIILFLVMAFRNNSAVSAYKNGSASFFSFQNHTRTFLNILFTRMATEDIANNVRARAVGLIIAFPYAVMLNLREPTRFPSDSIHGELSFGNIATNESSPTLPMAVVELTQLIERGVKSNVDAFSFYPTAELAPVIKYFLPVKSFSNNSGAQRRLFKNMLT